MSTDANEVMLESQSPFVGRQLHINHVYRWLSTPSAHSEVVHIIGLGGIGKSALLRRFLLLAREHQMRAIWVDGESCSGSLDRFLGMIEAQLPSVGQRRTEGSSRVRDLVDALAVERTLLCIDDFDRLESIHGWVQAVLMTELPPTGIFIALSARRPSLTSGDQGLPTQPVTTFMNLGPLTRAEVQQYFEALSLNQLADYELINGHPVAMVQVAQRQMNASSAYLAWPVSHTVSSRLLREFIAPELHEALDTLSILPDASYEELNGFLTSALTKQHWQQLTQLSFVRPATHGIRLDPVARTHLLNDFKHREPERFRNLRDFIMEKLNERCKTQNSGETAVTLMIVNRDILGAPICVLPTDVGSVHFEQVAPTDLVHLHKLIEEEQIQQTTTLRSLDDAHQLLDDMSKHFPESIRVSRDKDGKPAVFHAGLSLSRDSCEWVETHHPKVLAACFGADYHRMRHLQKENADTYFHLLGGASRQDKEHSFQELHGHMLLDGFSHIAGNGMRFTMTTSSDLSKDYFRPLGSTVRSLPGLSLWHPASADTVLELDWRFANLGGWLQSLMRKRTVRSTDRQTWQVTEADVMECLASIHHQQILERTVLGQRFGGMALYQRLQSLLNDSPPPPPLNTLHQSILKLLSQHPRLQPESAAQKLSVSRSSYYRHRQAALATVASILSSS